MAKVMICDDAAFMRMMIKDLNNHFMGECTEVGMYLAMSRQADREGYPEVAEAFKQIKIISKIRRI